MENIWKELIEETDNVYTKQINEMYRKTNANQYYEILIEALRKCWDRKKVLSIIPDEFINQHTDLYCKLFEEEENLQTDIPEKLYIDKPKLVAEIWLNSLKGDHNFRFIEYLKQKIEKLNLDNTFKTIVKIYNYKNAHLIKQKYNLKIDDINRFEAFKDKYYNEIVEKSNSVDEIGEAIANMFANCNKKELQQFMDKIQNIFLKRKPSQNDIEKFMKLKNLKELIDPIFYTKDIYQAKEIYNRIKESGFSYNDILIIKEAMKQICSQDLINNLSSFGGEPDLIKDNVSIYNISEKDFKLLIHNTGWGHHESEENINKRLSDLDNWNNREGYPFISTSYISNEMLGHVKSTENTDIIYGFNKSVNPSLVINMGNTDIQTQGKDIDNLAYEISDEWFMSDDLLENMVHRYNEVTIKRKYDENGKRVQPDYIVAFDSIKKIDLQYAKHFNIPIYFIDSTRCMERTLNNYSEMIKENDLYLNLDNVLKMCGKIISFGFGLEYNKPLQQKYAKRNLLKEYIINCRMKCDNNTFIKLLEKIENLSESERTLKEISKVDREKVIKLREMLIFNNSKQNDLTER